MLDALKDLYATLSGQPGNPSAPERERDLQLATAVLLVEVMRADVDMKPAEKQAVVAGLQAKFGLSQEAISSLMAQAEQQSKAANDYFYFTSLLNQQLDHAQKIRVVENMWNVAYADAALDANENHLISKIAGLLHVTHGEYIAAKLHAKESAPAARLGS